jgi:excisionase family DNA binding protein
MKKTTTKAGTFTRSADDRLISIAATAEYLDVTERTVRNKLYDGTLKAYKLGPRVVRLRLSEIDAALTLYGSA